jgi:hypothetical protein
VRTNLKPCARKARDAWLIYGPIACSGWAGAAGRGTKRPLAHIPIVRPNAAGTRAVRARG